MNRHPSSAEHYTKAENMYGGSNSRCTHRSVASSSKCSAKCMGPGTRQVTCISWRELPPCLGVEVTCHVLVHIHVGTRRLATRPTAATASSIPRFGAAKVAKMCFTSAIAVIRFTMRIVLLNCVRPSAFSQPRMSAVSPHVDDDRCRRGHASGAKVTRTGNRSTSTRTVPYRSGTMFNVRLYVLVRSEYSYHIIV